jgi:hypothetical protein
VDVLWRDGGRAFYVAQGGDWGALMVDVMATQGNPGLIGIHTNMPNAVPADLHASWTRRAGERATRAAASR